MNRIGQIKMAVSGGLTVLAFALALWARTPSCWLAALAMAVSSLGDAVLAGFPACFEAWKNRLVKGGLIFLAAHLVYIRALLSGSGWSVPALMSRAAVPFAVFFGLTVLHGAVFYVRASSDAPRAFFAAALLYLLTVGAHAASAFAVFMQTGGRYWLNAAGGALFYLSDAILLAGKYGSLQGKRTGLMIWLTYVPAQLCLLLGFFLGRQTF